MAIHIRARNMYPDAYGAQQPEVKLYVATVWKVFITSSLNFFFLEFVFKFPCINNTLYSQGKVCTTYRRDITHVVQGL